MDVESQDEEEEEAPSRVVSSEVVVNVRAQVDSFDYEGLSDGHSVQTLLTNIAPRHLVLAYGSRQVSSHPFAPLGYPIFATAARHLQKEITKTDPCTKLEGKQRSSKNHGPFKFCMQSDFKSAICTLPQRTGRESEAQAAI